MNPSNAVEAERKLDRFLTCLTSPEGFRRIEMLRYARKEGDATFVLSFPCRVTASNTVFFTAWVGLRFEDLAGWLDDDDGAKLQPLFVRPIHFLRQDNNFTEWQFSESHNLDALATEILSDLRNHALPFANRYSRMSEVRRALESPSKKDWIGIGFDVDTRITTLAAIQFVEGDKPGAVKTLDDALKALQETLAGKPHELRKRRFEIEYLRRRLLANG